MTFFVVAVTLALIALALGVGHADHDGAIDAAAGMLHVDEGDIRVELVELQTGSFRAFGRQAGPFAYGFATPSLSSSFANQMSSTPPS